MRKPRTKPARRRYPLNRIKQGSTYEPIDIAKLFGIHRNTVAQWLKQDLRPIDDQRPILVHGAALKTFLASRQEARRQRCRQDQFYCFRCRVPRSAWGETADVSFVTDKTAKLSALCSVCETPMHRIVRRADLAKISRLIDLPALAPTRLETKFGKNIDTYFFPVGDDLRTIVVQWIDELRTTHLFGPNDPVFPKTRIGQRPDKSFQAAGIMPHHWRDASRVREIFKQAFERAGLPLFPPHSFRHTLVHLMQTACRTGEQVKAWSQNLGHENIATTMMSYGAIDPHRQGDVIGGISLEERDPDSALVVQIAALMTRHRERSY